jgi:hypothetical protein
MLSNEPEPKENNLSAPYKCGRFKTTYFKEILAIGAEFLLLHFLQGWSYFYDAGILATAIQRNYFKCDTSLVTF